MQMKFKFASALSVVIQERITPTEATEGPYLDRFPEIAIAWSNHMIFCLAVNTMLFFWMWKPPEIKILEQESIWIE